MWKDRNFSNIRGDSRSSGLSIRGERDDVPGSHEIVDQLLTDKERRKISKKLDLSIDCFNYRVYDIYKCNKIEQM